MSIITEMTSQEACDYFLKHKSYCNFQVPLYFDFQSLLSCIKSVHQEKKNGLSDKELKKASNYDGVNYVLQTNEDGHYAWRPLQLIHPVLYVHLVSKITEKENWDLLLERFHKFASNEKIKCANLPREAIKNSSSDTAESVTAWWKDVEQLSITKALDFKYLFTTDIANFYPSIYTHSIAWAIHTKPVAKSNRHDENLIGNVIDKILQCMQNGQTNGIPQGSVLMDFISEIILGYADEELTEKLSALGIEDYYIIRYRDDYRVFTNSKEDAERIARKITSVLQGLGLQLNASKTGLTEDIVLDSIKEDKRDALILFKNQWEATIQKSLLELQKSLLELAMFSKKHPNSGQLGKQLTNLNKGFSNKRNLEEYVKPIVSILTDIMLNNPRSFASCASLLSNILQFVGSEKEKLELIEKVKSKFEHVPGTGILDIWLQRISFPIKNDIEYVEPLCHIVSQAADLEIWEVDAPKIWESGWIADDDLKLKTVMMNASFIDRNRLNECEPVIDNEEVALFSYNS